MELELVGYRYAKAELAVLMSLNGRREIPALPGVVFPDKEQFREGMESLEEGNMVSNVKGHLFVEKNQAVLLENLCACERYFSVRQGDTCVSLCACRQMGLLAESAGNGWVLKAAPAVRELGEEFLHALNRFPRGGTVRRADGKEGREYFCAPEKLNAEARETLAAFSGAGSAFA